MSMIFSTLFPPRNYSFRASFDLARTIHGRPRLYKESVLNFLDLTLTNINLTFVTSEKLYRSAREECK